MAIELKETFEIDAPLQEVWQFLLSPNDLARCMPGAAIDEVTDDGRFTGSLKMRVGAISVKYLGEVKYELVDPEQGRVVMGLQAGEGSGGTVNGSISTSLTSLSPTATRAQVESSVDLTGRLVQVGRGMIDGVARQVIGTFVKNVRGHFAAAPSRPDEAEAPGPTADDTAQKSSEPEALNVSFFVWQAFTKWLSSIVDRIFRRSKGGG